MSFDRDRLAKKVEDHGAVARIVVAEASGSAPREPGASMLVWDGGTEGTIGGGALEWAALERARSCLADGRDAIERVPLGPALGQCCGGAVTLLTEIFTPEQVPAAGETAFARRVPGGPETRPLAITRRLAAARSGARTVEVVMTDGWLIEPVSMPERIIWIYGAGHVGRALAATLSPLPNFAITLVDDADTRFPDELPEGVTRLLSANPADAVAHAPDDAEHFVLTYSHALDLEICHRVLSRPFRSLGLIGSATKRARFRKRLAQLGHAPHLIDRITCPIGDPALGKHPQAIAVSVASELLAPAPEKAARQTKAGT